MREKRSRSLAGKKSNGRHEFVLATCLLFVGALVVGFLWSKGHGIEKIFKPTVAATQENEGVYSEQDRVYLQKVLQGAKEASGQQ